MKDPPLRKPSQSRFATTVIEQTAGPVRDGGELVAPPVARKPTPVAMPAPPAAPVRRESHDDIERVVEMERAERERALLLARVQDAEADAEAARREAEQLRVPVASFPPQAAPNEPTPTRPSLMEIKLAKDIKTLEKAVVGSRWGKTAIAIGVMLALAWNAFNSVRQKAPEQKVQAVQERLRQNEQLSQSEIDARAVERWNNLQRMRALHCWAKQLRGATARQGLDLPSLPPGGIKALRLGDEDPNRPGPPRFVAEEKCPDFPPLPPDIATQ